MSRAALYDRKELANKTDQSIRDFITSGDNLIKKYHNKIDYIYEKIAQIARFVKKQEKKSLKKRKSVKKKSASRNS